MKTKTYTITTGQYDNYHIVARVEGPARPALSTLFREFMALTGAPLSQRDILTSATDIMWYIKRCDKAKRKASELGLGQVYEDFAEMFVRWLIKEYEYVKLPDDTFHCREW